MSARSEHFRAKLRAVSMTSVLMYGMPRALPGPGPALSHEPTPEPARYVDARAEALDVLTRLGAEPPLDGVYPNVADLVRQAYALGWAACEKRLSSPDAADAIAVAIETPERICTEPGYISGTGSKLRWQVAAVQLAAVHGVPK